MWIVVIHDKLVDEFLAYYWPHKLIIVYKRVRNFPFLELIFTFRTDIRNMGSAPTRGVEYSASVFSLERSSNNFKLVNYIDSCVGTYN